MRQKLQYGSLISLLGLNIALAGDFGRNIAKYVMPNPLEKRFLARTIYGEARGADEELKRETARVVLRRVRDKRWPNSVQEVVLQRKQFSCFNPEDPNWYKVWNPKGQTWQECQRIAGEELEKRLSKGANHYHTNKVNPNWSRNKTPVKKIQNTLFFNL